MYAEYEENGDSLFTLILIHHFNAFVKFLKFQIYYLQEDRDNEYTRYQVIQI